MVKPYVTAMYSLKKGDKKAFEAFFHAHKDAVYKYAILHLKEGEAAVDLVQEVFLRFWNKRADIDPQGNAKAYLYTIARNAVFDELRKRSLFNGYVSQAMIDQASHTDDNEERQNHNELHRIWQEAIGCLPERRRAIYRLSKLENLTNETIAKTLNISPNTVRDQLAKGNSYVRAYVRDAMGDMRLGTVIHVDV